MFAKHVTCATFSELDGLPVRAQIVEPKNISAGCMQEVGKDRFPIGNLLCKTFPDPLA